MTARIDISGDHPTLAECIHLAAIRHGQPPAAPEPLDDLAGSLPAWMIEERRRAEADHARYLASQRPTPKVSISRDFDDYDY